MVGIMTISIGMDDLIKMLQERQGKKSPEVFAPVIGIAAPTLRAYYAGLRTIGLPNGRKLIAYFEGIKDMEMAGVLRSYLEEKMTI